MTDEYPTDAQLQAILDFNVASRKICKELYKLSGWEDTHSFYCHSNIYFNGEYEDYGMAHYFHADNDAYTPAYDIGYLLRKLPARLEVVKIGKYDTKQYSAVSITNQYTIEHCDTPEDAAAKLAIELFKQGVLTKEEV